MRSRYGDDVNSNWGWARRRKKKNPVEQLPKWWPVSSSGSDQEEYQRMANRLILSLQICFPAILDNRMTGRDILVDDIIQQTGMWIIFFFVMVLPRGFGGICLCGLVLLGYAKLINSEEEKTQRLET